MTRRVDVVSLSRAQEELGCGSLCASMFVGKARGVEGVDRSSLYFGNALYALEVEHSELFLQQVFEEAVVRGRLGRRHRVRCGFFGSENVTPCECLSVCM